MFESLLFYYVFAIVKLLAVLHGRVHKFWCTPELDGLHTHMNIEDSWRVSIHGPVHVVSNDHLFFVFRHCWAELFVAALCYLLLLLYAFVFFVVPGADGGDGIPGCSTILEFLFAHSQSCLRCQHRICLVGWFKSYYDILFLPVHVLEWWFLQQGDPLAEGPTDRCHILCPVAQEEMKSWAQRVRCRLWLSESACGVPYRMLETQLWHSRRCRGYTLQKDTCKTIQPMKGGVISISQTTIAALEPDWFIQMIPVPFAQFDVRPYRTKPLKEANMVRYG